MRPVLVDRRLLGAGGVSEMMMMELVALLLLLLLELSNAWSAGPTWFVFSLAWFLQL